MPWSRARRDAEMASRWDSSPRLTSCVMTGLKKAFLRLLSSLDWPAPKATPWSVSVAVTSGIRLSPWPWRGPAPCAGIPRGWDRPPRGWAKRVAAEPPPTAWRPPTTSVASAGHAWSRSCVRIGLGDFGHVASCLRTRCESRYRRAASAFPAGGGSWCGRPWPGESKLPPRMARSSPLVGERGSRLSAAEGLQQRLVPAIGAPFPDIAAAIRSGPARCCPAR